MSLESFYWKLEMMANLARRNTNRLCDIKPENVNLGNFDRVGLHAYGLGLAGKIILGAGEVKAKYVDGFCALEVRGFLDGKEEDFVYTFNKVDFGEDHLHLTIEGDSVSGLHLFLINPENKEIVDKNNGDLYCRKENGCLYFFEETPLDDAKPVSDEEVQKRWKINPDKVKIDNLKEEVNGFYLVKKGGKKNGK